MTTKPPKPAVAASINTDNRQEKKSKLKDKFPRLTDYDICRNN